MHAFTHSFLVRVVVGVISVISLSIAFAALRTAQVGDQVEAAPTGTSYAQCSVVSNRSRDGGYDLKCPNGTFFVPYKSVRTVSVGAAQPGTAAAMAQSALTKPAAAPVPSSGGAASAAGVFNTPVTQCRVGQRVATPSGSNGVVTETYGDSGCRVRDGHSGLVTSWAASMLMTSAAEAASGPGASGSASGGNPPTGRYQCYYLAGTVLNYALMDVNITSASTYTDRNGAAGSYKSSGDTLTFTSGPLSGEPARFRSGKIVLGKTGNMSCGRK